MQKKINFTGLILSVQPRSNVWRYRLDNRTHTLTGRNLFLTGIADNEEASFSVAVSEKQQEKFGFAIGDQISGNGVDKKESQGRICRLLPLRRLQEGFFRAD